MQEQELLELIRNIEIRKTESQTIELKSAEKGFPGRIYDTLSSFSNQDNGGILIFGIQEKPEFHIVGVYDASEVQTRIMEACQQMEPQVRAEITMCRIDGKTVVAAEIPGADVARRPVYYRGIGILKGSYIRVGDEDLPMTAYEIYSYEAYRKHAEDDLRTVARSELDVFDQNRISQYLQNIKSERKNLSEIPDDSILELAGVTKGGLYTLAGVLTFSMFPQIYYPQLCITAVSVPGLKIGDQTDDGLRFIDNKRITGTIPDMVDEAVSFVKKNSRVSTVIDADGQRRDRPEYPLRAVREAVLNALVHRDYSEYTQNTPVSIEMYRDRIVFRSPGTLFGRATVDMLGKSRPEARNAALINMLEILHITENRYSGIPTMYHELQKQRLPDPEFEVSRGDFVVTFRNSIFPEEAAADKRDLEKAILQYCMVPRSRKELVAFTGLSQYYLNRKYLEPMLGNGSLKLTIPDKPRSSRQRFVSC